MHKSIIELLDGSASTDGIIQFEQPTRSTIKFADIWSRSARLAARLKDLVGSSKSVCGILRAEENAIGTLLACWLAGLDFASLPDRARGMSQIEHDRQIKEIIKLLGCSVMFVRSPDEAIDITEISKITYRDIYESTSERHPLASGGEVGRLIQFTSGSTSLPKGIAIGMDQIGFNVRSMAEAFGFNSSDTSASWLPLSHDMGLIGTVMLPIASMSKDLGGIERMWLLSPEGFIKDPLHWLKVDSGKSSSFTMVPNFALDLMTRKLAMASHLDLTPFRHMIISAETVKSSSLARFARACAQFGFDELAYQPAYGMAEVTLGASTVASDEMWSSLCVNRSAFSDGKVIITDSSIASQPRHLDKSSEYLIDNEEIVCLGKPFPGFAIEIDSEQEDQIGNVLIKSGSIAQEMFGQEMRLDNNGFLKTDDLGFIRDGELYFAGRSDDWIVVAGRNLDARAIEQMASNHEAVRAGNCVAVIDELGTYALVAEPSDELAASISGQQSSSSGYVLDQIANEITRLIGPLSGISPSRIIFVERGKLPKTPSGKLQRRKVSLGLDRLEAKIHEYWVKN